MFRSLQRFTLAIGLCGALASSYASAAETAANAPVNHLQTPTSIVFGATTYTLVWSSQPTAEYVKQEYLPKGESVRHFSRMMLIERIEKGSNVKDAVAAQISKIKAQRQKNPAPYLPLISNMLENPKTHEVILEFFMYEKPVTEWNAYRYTATPSGQGVMLVGISHRGYEDEEPYLPELTEDLKQHRAQWIDELANMPLPIPAKAQ